MHIAPISPYFIDRVSHLREDDLWIQAQLKNESTRLVIVYQASVLCYNNDASLPCFLPYQQTNIDSKQSVFLGMVDGINYFTLPVQTKEAAHQLCQLHQAHFQNHAAGAPMLDSDYRDLLSLACFTSYWHRRNRYCGTCGSPTQIGSAGHIRVCSSATCTQQYFPSMDPAVIVLIEHKDHCLLGRQKNWPEGMHSTLAGFVEPGESIEATVSREVMEEAGIQVEDIRYHSSQAWLFPNSLMLGFNAKAKTKELHIDTNELEAANWFTRDQINANPQMLPNHRSISYALIQDWLKL